MNEDCIYNVSDEDCNKCFKKGIVMRCDWPCEYYRRSGYVSERERQ